MTLRQFDNGYWYATELRQFAKTIGIPFSNRLRKDELETAIKRFLKTGVIERPGKAFLPTKGVRDVERGLRLDLPVVIYTNDSETKDFLEREARKRAPGLKRKSGTRYRLNRWREQQLARGVKLTYRDLVDEHVRLNRTEGSFAKIPHGRYINFMSDFLAKEPGATREQAIDAWKTLKTLDAPKDYRSWARIRSRTRR